MSKGRSFPNFTERMTERGMSATEMQTMSDAAKRSAGFDVGSGAQIRRGTAGDVISIDPTRDQNTLSTTRFVAVVVAPEPLDNHVWVRDVVYGIEEPESVDTDDLPGDENVTLVRGDFTYRWGSPSRIKARPGFGYVPMDFAGGVFKDVADDDNDPETPLTTIQPTAQTKIYWLQLRGQGPPLLWPMGEGESFEFAILREIPPLTVEPGSEEEPGPDLDGFLVIVEGVNRTPEGWELTGDRVEIATYPGIPARYYEPFLWQADELALPATPFLRVFTVSGDTYLEQTARWAFIKVGDTVRLTDCTPIARITGATP